MEIVKKPGDCVRVYNGDSLLVSAYRCVEAGENIRVGDCLTWKNFKKGYKVKPANKKDVWCGVAIRNMVKGEFDLIKTYGYQEVRMKK